MAEDENCIVGILFIYYLLFLPVEETKQTISLYLLFVFFLISFLFLVFDGSE